METNAIAWSHESICLRPSSLEVPYVAADMYERTCRTHFDAPGFCLLSVGGATDSVTFRQLMVDLKRAMAALHLQRTGNTLVYLSAARFDQQETTRPHLDSGPEECFLMLGYEPTEVAAELEIVDYAKCAFDLGLSPQEFLVQHNPMLQSGYERLRSYSTRLPCFSPRDYQIVCVNNSCAPFSKHRPMWQGTLHTATILTPDDSKRRVINSTMIASVPAGTPDMVSETQQEAFVKTSTIRRRGYDKTHLTDDA